jgi:hypothetical protein
MKKLIAFIISFVIIIPAFSGVALANNETQTQEQQEDICSKIGSTTDTSKMYVILEEPLGGPDAIYCFRVCTKEIKQGKRVCELKPVCEGGGDLGENVSCQRIQVIEADSGVNLLNQYVGMIYFWAAGTIGIIAVLTIVISGVQIMTAGGDSGKIDPAKTRIVQALFGLVILFLSGLILYTVNPTFFV